MTTRPMLTAVSASIARRTIATYRAPLRASAGSPTTGSAASPSTPPPSTASDGGGGGVFSWLKGVWGGSTASKDGDETVQAPSSAAATGQSPSQATAISFSQFQKALSTSWGSSLASFMIKVPDSAQSQVNQEQEKLGKLVKKVNDVLTEEERKMAHILSSAEQKRIAEAASITIHEVEKVVKSYRFYVAMTDEITYRKSLGMPTPKDPTSLREFFTAAKLREQQTQRLHAQARFTGHGQLLANKPSKRK